MSGSGRRKTRVAACALATVVALGIAARAALHGNVQLQGSLTAQDYDEFDIWRIGGARYSPVTTREGELVRLRTINRAVLAGRLSPAKLLVARSYASYYAVVPASARVPGNRIRVYGNAEYALYRIARQSAG